MGVAAKAHQLCNPCHGFSGIQQQLFGLADPGVQDIPMDARAGMPEEQAV